MPRAYIDLVKESLQAIESSYYRLVTTYERDGIVRERVFCYELYHQVRLRMQPDQLLSLHGEVDKRGHRDFEQQHRKNPDFVFHVPGTHEFNTLVIELKGTLDYDRVQERPSHRVAASGQRRRRPQSTAIGDIQNLLVFVNRYRYRAGVFILYNHTFDELNGIIGYRLRALREQPGADQIYLLTIGTAHQPCEEHTLRNL